ncbi:MAG TPA: DISARM system helicase DrmA [Candidatus Nitrosotalea sp.]|nr:DISARM system helicase DrmA [Candidatus Nitrosotalea sp.]
MREIFVTQLVKEVLGPRGGICEILESNPLSEYITGILSPIQKESDPKNVGIDNAATLPIDDSGMSEEDDVDEDVEISALLSPVLDPKRIPSTMGISFFVKTQNAQADPRISVCLTWARYYRSGQGKVQWTRNPRGIILDVTLDSDRVFYFNTQGKETDAENAEVSFHTLPRKKENNSHFITLYLVNRIKIPDAERQPVELYHIFQPQIRVKCEGGTEIIQDLGKKKSDFEEEKMEFLYRNRQFYARGHLCSAMWQDIDPENQLKVSEILDFPTMTNEPPFKWVDGELFSESKRSKFLPPHLKTEYVPLYSIPSPEYEWQNEFEEEPELRAEQLADLWDPVKLRRELTKIVTGYKNWMKKMESVIQTLDNQQRNIAGKVVPECKIVLERIASGIEILCDDRNDDARLAFCLANKAIDTQSLWAPRGKHLVWRPFQLAFILMSLESIIHERSAYRNVCDLLWVPTGAGKTEAYLALIAFTISYRRREALKRKTGDRTGAGISVISRYTLRLLTIQQFRRTLSLIAALEYLRVFNLSKGDGAGWLPAGCTKNEKMIWSSTPFSVGLWVGRGVTPNRMQKTGWGVTEEPGALDLLSGRTFSKSTNEPAQILNCPACGNMLSIPERGLQRGDYQLYFIVKSENGQNISSAVAKLEGRRFRDLSIKKTSAVQHYKKEFHTISLDISVSASLSSKTLDEIWDHEISNYFKIEKLGVRLLSSRASRPGYFLRYYKTQQRTMRAYDFEIFCPNPNCFLKTPWCGGAPAGSIHDRNPDGILGSDGPFELTDGNNFTDVQEQFQLGVPVICDRIPITAFTVDEQIYRRVPSVLVATVDKFARLPFEPDSGMIFGNVEFHHSIWGYYRLDDKGHPSPAGKTGAYNYLPTNPLFPPNLILQDELHLIEGPLGSLTGLYETAVDYLCRTSTGPVKYVASTATIRRSDEQVQSVFARKLQTFPPHGLYASDRFFIRDYESHSLDDKKPGRLYLGICAPGKGPLTPLVRIWSRLAQVAWENRNHSEIDRFWTLTGYFNAVRELAGARALYRQDIKERINHLFPDPRKLLDEKAIELSSRTPSTDLPEILDILAKRYPDTPDGLFTTSIFGTGVDISRIGLMIVNGQPKTTSSYIQSTGRVGRGSGALVVTFFRASRPRDLSHYEFFCRHHRQLQRFVESPTVYPFSPGAIERALGAVGVAILRNTRNPLTQWKLEAAASLMNTMRNNAEVTNLPKLFEDRAGNQPDVRKPSNGKTLHDMNSEIDRWQSFALNYNNLQYVEYSFRSLPQLPVVLGDAQHQHLNIPVVYRNAPQSLRDVEETIGVQT